MTGEGGREQREQDRLAELHRYEVLDSESEPAFDELVRAAATIARTPFAAVSLVDEHRQWFKALEGLTGRQTGRDVAFCDLVVQDESELIVTDTLTEPRLANNPDVIGGPQYRFYAGFPLRTPTGAILGTLCVIDQKPGALSPEQIGILRTLADQVMAQLQLRLEIRQRDQLIAQREAAFDRLAESERRYRFLVEHSTDVISQHHPDGTLIYISPTLENVLGLPADSPDNTDLPTRTHPDDVPGVISAWEQMLDGQERRVVQRVMHHDGTYRHMETTLKPILDADGELHEVLATSRDVTQRRITESALEEAREALAKQSGILEQAQQLAQVGSWSADLLTDQVAWSPEAHRILGTDPTMPLSTTTFLDYVHPDDHGIVQQTVGQAFAAGRSDAIEFRVIRTDGATRTLRSRYQVDQDANGRPVRLSGILLDITQARQAQQQVAEAKELFEQLLYSATEQAIICTDLDGRITVFNRGAEHMLGFTAAELIGTGPPHSTVAPDGATAAAQAIRRVREGAREVRHDTTWIRRDGVHLTVQLVLTPMRRHDGELVGIVAIGTDVTDVRRVEGELIEAQAMFNQVMDASTEQAIFVVDALTGQIRLFNSGAERMIGYSAQEAIGSTLFRQFHHREEVRARSTQHGLDPGQPNDVEVFLRATQAGDREWGLVRKDGSARVVLLTVNEMLSPQGEVTGWLSVGTDITQARQAEQEVQAALLAVSQARDEALAANQAKSAFLATMSHEIRTPMNAVIGMTGLLLDTGLDDEQRDLLETVRGSGDQLLAIINDILDFSKIEAGDLDLEHRSFDLRDLVEGTVAQFAGSAKGLDLISHVDDGCPANVAGDVTRLRQVLSNLISNAIKFTSAGEILVRVECEPAPGDQIRLLVSVRDTGIGIPAESMDRLFKSFSQVDASTTRNYGGTGLGLAISKALVNAMGGEIGVQSVIGSGSTFSFSVLAGLDDSALELRPGRMDARTLRATLAGRRVLIVDDNATNRQILTLQLGGQGMETVDIGTPVAALQLLADPAEHFDLAILDLAMPVLDGIQLAGAVHRLPGRPGLPLLLLSSLGRRLGEDEQLFAAVLTKPVRSAALLESIAKALSSEGDPAATVPVPSRPMDDAAASAPGSVPVPAPAPSVPGEPSRAALTPLGQAGVEPGARLRILLAEDNEVNQKVGRLMLARLGYQTDIVANGEEALAAAREHHYGVVLMDMHMPVMDGLEATRRIRAELPQQRQPRIVALTASVTMQDREACTEAGMDSYLSKPVRPDELAAAIAQATEARDD